MIETERLLLRKPVPGDAEPALALHPGGCSLRAVADVDLLPQELQVLPPGHGSLGLALHRRPPRTRPLQQGQQETLPTFFPVLTLLSPLTGRQAVAP